jgi:hypothetical protein
MDDNRRMPRTKKRLSCTVMVSQQRYTGIVIDVSATGLFVQTNATPKPGTQVTVELQVPGGETIALNTAVARRRNVPAHLKSIARGGIGLCIEGASESYFALIGELQGEKTAPPKPAAKKPQPKEAPHSSLARKALLKRLDKLRSEAS